MTFQRRYVAYAKAHGRTPEEQKATERSNVGFMLWISLQHQLYCEEHGIRRDSAEHMAAYRGTAFDSWLQEGVKCAK